MSSLRILRKRIQSTQSVKELTKAMEMGAAAKLHRAQSQAELSRPYRRAVDELLVKVASALSDPHPLCTQRVVKKRLLVVIGADRGLCGSYGANIYHEVESFLSTYPKETVDLLLVGASLVNHFTRRPWRICHHYTDLVGKASSQQIHKLSSQLVEYFLQGTYDEIYIAYTRYITVFSNKVAIHKFLNITVEQSRQCDHYLFEPSSEKLLEELLGQYSFVQMQGALYEAHASELASRIVAMRAATKNAEEMIDGLTLQLNKLRQAGITKEMVEIAAGVESLTKE